MRCGGVRCGVMNYTPHLTRTFKVQFSTVGVLVLVFDEERYASS